MTGGQMAPTTLPLQRTTTTPNGRDVLQTGYPLRVSEMLATLQGTAFVARGSVDSPKAVITTKKLIRRAFEYQIGNNGFSFVEILSPCPTDWDLTPRESLRWLRDAMVPVYPLGVLKDTWNDAS
jgi:2-oxoglutarate ferredoxin oxidoreductase subunit beta